MWDPIAKILLNCFMHLEIEFTKQLTNLAALARFCLTKTSVVDGDVKENVWSLDHFISFSVKLPIGRICTIMPFSCNALQCLETITHARGLSWTFMDESRPK